MTNRDKLEENVADSILALLMDDYAQSEGERYMKENELLQNDPEAAVPEDMERRALRLIEREIAKKNRQHTGRKILRLLGRAAVAALIAVLLFTAAFALSPAFRAGTLNLLMQIDSQVATWRFVPGAYSVPDTFAPSNMPLSVTIENLPEGFFQEEPLVSTPSDLVVLCTNTSGQTIRLTIHTSIDGVHTLDMEEADYYTPITVQGCEGMLVEKNDTISIDWAYNNTDLVVCIESSDIDADTLLQVAESVTLLQ